MATLCPAQAATCVGGTPALSHVETAACRMLSHVRVVVATVLEPSEVVSVLGCVTTPPVGRWPPWRLGLIAPGRDRRAIALPRRRPSLPIERQGRRSR